MIDTMNRFMIAARGEQLCILGVKKLMMPISREDALNLAAYLVSMADPDGEEFKAILKAVQNA